MSDFTIRPEASADEFAVNKLIQTIFGPAMYARAAFALREGVNSEPDLNFVAESNAELIGVVRQTKIRVGSEPVLMLGPLGVSDHVNGKGVGTALMNATLTSARANYLSQGFSAVLLVGDISYYKAFGFRTVPMGNITLPRPADPSRILIYNLQDENKNQILGAASKWK